MNPLQARRFAEACGTRAKTDAVDARMLARMGAQLDLPPDPLVSEVMRELRELQHGALRPRARPHRPDPAPAARRACRSCAALLPSSLRAVERQLAAIEAEIEARIAADPELVARQRILASIPSFGPRSCAALPRAGAGVGHGLGESRSRLSRASPR